MNDYEAKRQARIDRLNNRAAKATSEAAARFNSGNVKALRQIPFGQPILVGHHSEKRHRRLIEKADNDMRKACEATDKAAYYEQRAAAAESNTAISSDNPDAVSLLQEKLTELERLQATYKKDNAAIKKAKIVASDPAIVQKLIAVGVTERHANELATTARLCPYHMRPFVRWPAYALSNNNANITRVKNRIADLQRRAAVVATVENKTGGEQEIETASGDGWRLVEDFSENRVCFYFDGKPAADVRSMLKGYAFKWSPSRGAWVRMLNGNGRAAASWAVAKLQEMGGESTATAGSIAKIGGQS